MGLLARSIRTAGHRLLDGSGGPSGGAWVSASAEAAASKRMVARSDIRAAADHDLEAIVAS